MTSDQRNEIAVLVVDDDESIRTLLTKVLERERFGVDLARDGVEAIDRLDASRYDAVLLDLMMPRVDGFGVIEHLRRSAPDFLSRVIVMTAFASAARDRLQGSCAIISKPFELPVLIAAIRECVGSRPPGLT